MMVIPFSFLPRRILEALSSPFLSIGTVFSKLFPFLQLDLDRADFRLQAKKYVAMCFVASSFLFFLLSVTLTLILFKVGLYFLGVLIAFVISVILLVLQMRYPTLISHRRIRKLEADLLSGLRAILVHLDSGVPLFDALTTVSRQQFGQVSKEFAETVKKINSGMPQIEALELMALKNPSPYFRKTIWQIINGMKEGASITTIMRSVITNLGDEQLIQIEQYGSQLSPFAMFYMMGAVILPSLGVTFLIVLSSFVGLSEFLVKFILWALFFFVLFFQIMFAGVVKTKRPSLLGE